MVVVAIVGVLAAVAVPAYKNYSNNVKISKALSLSFNVLKQASTTNAGNIPTNIQPVSATPIDGLSNAYAISESGPWAIWYNYVNDSAAYITVAVSGLNIDTYPTYFDPNIEGVGYSIFTNASSSMLNVGIKIVDGVVELKCGTWSSGNGANIPIGMLPHQCTCANIGAWLSGGAC